LPALERGQVVVSDRYDLSSVAYQSATAPDPSTADWIATLNAQALRPDLTVVVDVTADCAAARRASRSGHREIYEVDSLQRRLVELYSRAERLVPERLVHVDGMVAAEAVLASVLGQVRPVLEG